MIAIVDYGVGNLFSLLSSLRALDLEAEVTGDAGRLRAADRIILPGVGAFGDAMDKLTETGLIQAGCHRLGAGDSGGGGEEASPGHLPGDAAAV